MGIPISPCSKSCNFDEMKHVGDCDMCFWICIRCQPFENLENECTSRDCGKRTRPTVNRKSCF
ncbi:hypothetical protein DPMN_122392 [Dreissena polymorpha]|uniref:Uncharacterized protein n=1 Tax=Dreissena polymorpha TaxID=45954 RepID=A0A9D4GPB0_DREPO|nr:hypothetical protein DPMN_122392 [Dreissena polymorpha]